MTWILAAALPFVGLLAWWARHLGGRQGAPRWVKHVAWAPIAIWLVSVAGTAYGMLMMFGGVTAASSDANQRARAIAEGISNGMNATALAVLVLGFFLAVVAVVLGVVTVRLKKPQRPEGAPPYR